MIQAELRFNGVARVNGVQAQSAASIMTYRASQVAAKAVVLRQQIRLLLVHLIDKMFIQRRSFQSNLLASGPGPQKRVRMAGHQEGQFPEDSAASVQPAVFPETDAVVELYDLQEYLYELKDLAGHPDHKAETEMRQELDKWMVREQDCLPLHSHSTWQW